MKNLLKIAFAVLLLLMGVRQSFAQATICNDVAPQDMISNFADWKWDIDRNDPLYCRTWALRYRGTTNGKVYGAPWLYPGQGILERISNTQDYTRAAGWELLRMNLGGKTVVTTPYFILYNKYTSAIRTYFWLDNSNGTYNSGAVITMSHSTNSRVSALTSFSTTPSSAPDKYITQQQDNEVISYVTKMSSQIGWIVGEFTPAFDPYFRDYRYDTGSLQFEVYGTVNSTIALKGDFNFKTNTEEGFAIAGKKSEVIKDKPGPNGLTLKEFTTAGKTIVGVVDNVDKFLGLINAGATQLAKSKDYSTSNVGLALSIATRPSGTGTGTGPSLRGILGTVLGIGGQANAALGIVGSLIGAIWPDAAAKSTTPPFVPTVSKGSISLTGTITTNYPLTSVICQIPGTRHSSDLSTAPYYDGALGLFNIKSQLTLNKKSYSGWTGSSEYYCGGDGSYYNTQNYYDSYQVQNDLEGVYNQAAGLDLISAEAALITEVPDSIKPYYIDPNSPNLSDLASTSFIYDDGCMSIVNRSYLSAEIKAGVALITQFDNGQRGVANKPTILQTPFVPFGCVKNLALTTTAGAKIYLRVKVVLKASDTSKPQPLVYFVHDYAVAINNNAAATNPAFNSSPYDGYEPPFTNLTSPIVDDPSFYNQGPGGIAISGQYNSPTTVQSIGNIVTAPNSNTSFSHSSATSSQLLAGYSIALEKDFSVTPGTNFVAAIGLLSQRVCGNSLVTANTQTWGYNTSAYRVVPPATKEENSQEVDNGSGLDVFPNPTTGNIKVLLHGYTGKATIDIMNSLGQPKISKAVNLKGGIAEQVDISSLASGVYIIRITTPEGKFTKKLTVL